MKEGVKRCECPNKGDFRNVRGILRCIYCFGYEPSAEAEGQIKMLDAWLRKEKIKPISVCASSDGREMKWDRVVEEFIVTLNGEVRYEGVNIEDAYLTYESLKRELKV